MLDLNNSRTGVAAGPQRESLDLDSLPPPNPGRWVSRRKAQVIAAIADGLLTVEDACARYSLSVEELTNWQWLFDRDGVDGLRAMRTKQYRALVSTF